MLPLTAILVPLGAANAWALAVGRFVALCALAAMVAVILLQVWYRYVVNAALPWPDEAARFLMLWMTGLAAPTAYRQSGFVAIDMVRDLLPGRLASILSLILLALSLAVLVMGVQLGWNHVQSGWLFNSSSLRLPLDLLGGSSVRIKLAWMYMSVWVGMVLLTSVNIELILREIVRLGGRADALSPIRHTDLPEAE